MAHRHSTPFRRTAAATLAALALAASPAAARPAQEPVHHDSSLGAAPAQAVDRSDGGFEWGSAVIGAGAATAACLLAGVGLTTASRRHHREPRTPSASAA